MFTKSADWYDAIYASVGKDYAGESARLDELIQRHKLSTGTALLDVACGTGAHLEHLSSRYLVEGLDLDVGILEVARRRLPTVAFHQCDMFDFSLGKQFDVVTCLFGSIGYVGTEERLRGAISTMARHLVVGGVVVLEPWLSPESYVSGRVYATFVDQPDLKVARMNVSAVEEGVSMLDFQYLVATPAGVSHFTERHKLTLFSDQQYLEALMAADLAVFYEPKGLTGRGLYVGRRQK